MSNYEHLLSPVRIGNTIIKNRLMYPNASPHFLQGPETYPAEGFISFLSGLAKAGAGILTVNEWCEYPQQRKGDMNMDGTHMQAFDLTDPAVHNYISAMADEVHMFGSKILFNYWMRFPAEYSLNGGREMSPMGEIERQPAPVSVIKQMIQEGLEKVEFYRNLGFDGVNLRFDEVLAPSKNPRPDEYGGSMENRTRYILEFFEGVKSRFGADFITEGVVTCEQRTLGLTMEDTVEFARLAEGKIDILQIRERDFAKSHPLSFNFRKGEHDAVKCARMIKDAGIRILTEPIGGFQDPDELEAYIANGDCDMIGMARGLFADFDYVKKLYENRADDIVPCLFCNKCHGEIKTPHRPWISVCSVNPVFGMQQRLPRLVDEPDKSKKVAVIGGGAAGMRAAIFAAERGHSVTLYEKSGVLGGQLLHADSFSFKWSLHDYKEWMIRQLSKKGVDVRLCCEPTPDMIKALGYDAILAATGAEAQRPSTIKGAADCPTCVDIFGREAELGRRVAVVGGSETGMETAMYLAENGHDVTVLTRQAELGHDASKLHYVTMAYVREDAFGYGGMGAAWELYDNLKGIVNVTTSSVENGHVVYTDNADGTEGSIDVDSVVICGGMRPRVDEALQYANCAPMFFVIGDANGAGNLQVCSREAYFRTSII